MLPVKTVGVEIVEDDLDLPAAISSDNFVHEGKELLAARDVSRRRGGLDTTTHLEGAKSTD